MSNSATRKGWGDFVLDDFDLDPTADDVGTVLDGVDAPNVQCRAVTAGYHLNQRHWNTIILDGSVPPDALCEWIGDSYDLVLKTLTRAERAALD
jgi:hypothetical protein